MISLMNGSVGCAHWYGGQAVGLTGRPSCDCARSAAAYMAIRSGVPYKITKTLHLCTIYVDIRITPVQDPLTIREELRRLIAGAGFEGEVELYTYRRGYEAKGVEPLAEAVGRAHERILGGRPPIAAPPLCSMWRDLNVFNEVGIPSLTYGPGASVGGGNLSMRLTDLHTAAKVYALTALDVCNRDRDGE